MIDIHAHILPGLDDGAEDLDNALKMAALAVQSGVNILAVTPHCVEFDQHKNFWDQDLHHSILAFRQALDQAGIPLQIVPGMEIYGTDRVPNLLREGKMIGLNGSRYPLIEFSFHHFAAQATDILGDILDLGMRPVIAHPERYEYVQRDPAILNLWVEMGCLLQINKGSLLGRFGPVEERLALELVDRGFAFAVASDAHSPSMRTTWMKDVRDLLRHVFSREAAKALLENNPRKLIDNESIQREDPYWFR